MTMIIFSVFTILVIMTNLRSEAWHKLLTKKSSHWYLDGLNLIMQGLVIPFINTSLLYFLFCRWFPNLRGSVGLWPIWAFLINFVAVDYLYYWNHRLLHSNSFWRWHAVHHTAERMDVFVTSRNTVWSHFLILYVWVNGIVIFLLKDPTFFILSATATAILDLWRHSETYPKKGSLSHWVLSQCLMTPHEHAWHHSQEQLGRNFGANLSWWDRLHGTYSSPALYPARLGVDLNWNFFEKFLFAAKVRR